LPEAATQGANRFRYYVFVTDRDARLAQLHAAGIDARPSIAHDMCAYFRLDERAFPNLGNNGRQLISLPIHLALDAAAITRVAEQLTNW
jgi:dTDP-4-amino-4,6-dideoxygalactose transaminase